MPDVLSFSKYYYYYKKTTHNSMNLQYKKINKNILDCEKFSDLTFSTPKDLYILENIYIFLAVCT